MRTVARSLIRRTGLIALSLAAAAAAGAAPVDAPDMSSSQMAALMDMNDAAPVGKAMIDQLELDGASGHTLAAWEGQAWYGGDYDKAWLKSEGSPEPDGKTGTRTELLWDHLVARWWSLQTGVRYDLGHGPARGWAAAGMQGLSPYGFDIEAAFYLGDGGRTAVRFKAEHDVLITQRLIVQPELEADLYGKTDAARQEGSGLSDLQLALRLRYEIRREVAPYVGIAWRRDLGPTARFARMNGTDTAALCWVAGLHGWF